MKNKLILPGVALVLGILLAVFGVTMDGKAGNTFTFKSNKSNSLSNAKLAAWIIEGKRDFVVVDMRSAAEFKKGHIKDAVNCGVCHTNNSQGRIFMSKNPGFNLSKKIVVYTQAGNKKIQLPKIMKDNLNIMELAGGYAAWKKDVLADVAFNPTDTPSVVAMKKKKVAIANFFLGKTIKAPVIKFKPVVRKTGHKSGADEGC